MDVARNETAISATHKFYLQMEGKFIDADVRLEIIDGKFNINIGGEVQALKTQLFKMFDAKKLVLAGGSVAAFCYALYQFGYNAHSFSPKCLQFTLDLSEDEIPVMKRKIGSGDFQRVLYKKTMEIIKEYEMTNLENLTFGAVSLVGDKDKPRADKTFNLDGAEITDSKTGIGRQITVEHGAGVTPELLESASSTSGQTEVYNLRNAKIQGSTVAVSNMTIFKGKQDPKKE